MASFMPTFHQAHAQATGLPAVGMKEASGGAGGWFSQEST